MFLLTKFKEQCKNGWRLIFFSLLNELDARKRIILVNEISGRFVLTIRVVYIFSKVLFLLKKQ